MSPRRCGPASSSRREPSRGCANSACSGFATTRRSSRHPSRPKKWNGREERPRRFPGRPTPNRRSRRSSGNLPGKASNPATGGPSRPWALAAYIRARDRLVPRPKSDHFFLSDQGKGLPYSTVRTVFRKLCDRLQIPGTGRRRPRLHDLRHTFAWLARRDRHGRSDSPVPKPIGPSYVAVRSRGTTRTSRDSGRGTLPIVEGEEHLPAHASAHNGHASLAGGRGHHSHRAVAGTREP